MINDVKQKPVDYEKAYNDILESYLVMTSDSTAFFIKHEGVLFFEKDTVQHLKMAKMALEYFDAKKQYKELNIIYNAVEEFLKKENIK